MCIRDRCEITGLRSTHSSVQSLDFEDCRLNEIEWKPLMSNGAFPDPIHTLKECSLKYNTFTEMNFNRFNFSDGNEIVGSMFAKCEMQLANFKGVELHETELYQCDLRKEMCIRDRLNNLADMRIDEDAISEFRQLSRSFNQMLERLNNAFAAQRQFKMCIRDRATALRSMLLTMLQSWVLTRKRSYWPGTAQAETLWRRPASRMQRRTRCV